MSSVTDCSGLCMWVTWQDMDCIQNCGGESLKNSRLEDIECEERINNVDLGEMGCWDWM